MTYNLHILVCRLPEQEDTCGPASKDIELWVERSIQRLKKSTKYRTTEYPEKIAVKRIIMEQQMQKLKSSRPDLRTFDDLVPAYRAADIRGDIDTGSSAFGSQLLGRGKEISATEEEELKPSIDRLMRTRPEINWTPEDTAQADILSHSAALKSGDEIIDSLQNRRARSRCSHYVRIAITLRSGNNSIFIARVNKFLRVTSSGSDEVLRLASCTLFKATAVQGMLRIDESRPYEENALVAVDSIDAKVVTARQPTGGAGVQLYCLPYGNTSGVA